MAIYNTTQTPLFTIPSPTIKGYKLTNLSSSTVNGSTMYSLKTCGNVADNILYPPDSNR